MTNAHTAVSGLSAVAFGVLWLAMRRFADPSYGAEVVMGYRRIASFVIRLVGWGFIMGGLAALLVAGVVAPIGAH